MKSTLVPLIKANPQKKKETKLHGKYNVLAKVHTRGSWILIHMPYVMANAGMDGRKKLWFFFKMDSELDTNWLLRNGNRHLSGT